VLAATVQVQSHCIVDTSESNQTRPTYIKHHYRYIFLRQVKVVILYLIIFIAIYLLTMTMTMTRRPFSYNSPLLLLSLVTLLTMIRLNNAFVPPHSSSSFSSTMKHQRTGSLLQKMSVDADDDDESLSSSTQKGKATTIASSGGTGSSSSFAFASTSSSKHNNQDGGDDRSPSTVVQFGDVMPLKRPAATTTATSIDAAGFGDVVPLKNPPATIINNDALAADSSSAVAMDPESAKRRNIVVATLSVCLAVGNYAWQWSHPIEPIQLLFTMEKNSAPVTAIGSNSKPTVVDFWAPWYVLLLLLLLLLMLLIMLVCLYVCLFVFLWSFVRVYRCENCKFMAPTLMSIEEEYKDKVNFVMVNGDSPQAWPLIEAFGVDAIPHLALVEADGTVDTALIGPVPKRWLSSDLDVLIENANNNANVADRKILPFQMLDVFANRPDQRKIVVSSPTTSSN
jgi:thiol-disulfide isomerase/thioredoxin